MALVSSPEFRLAAACSIWPPSDRRSEAIHNAAVGPLDWDRFLRVAKRHCVVGLVHDGLIRARVAVPSQIAQKIDAQARALVQHNLALAAEAVRIQRMFVEADLPVLFLKGTSLAVLAYGSLGLRESKDLDLFVPAENLSAAIALIERAGYRRFEPPATITGAQMQLLLSLRKDFGYVHEGHRAEIELHWRLLLNPHFMDETTVMKSSRIVPITTMDGLRTLGSDDLFAYLCGHGSVHWWCQLKWLADVASLLSAVEDGSVEQFYSAAVIRGVGKAAAQAILLCHRLLRTKVPGELVMTLDRHVSMRWLEVTALKAMSAGGGELEPHKLLFGSTRGSISRLLVGQDWHYWLAELKSLLICQTDVLMLGLPKRLQFLYPLLRLPLWVWRRVEVRIRRF
jgi:hypothetical protein